MTIIEALKSGKRFRRKGDCWRSFGPCGTAMTKEDLLADDWEVEEKRVEITLDSFAAAWNRCAMIDSVNEKIAWPRVTFHALTKELGLID